MSLQQSPSTCDYEHIDIHVSVYMYKDREILETHIFDLILHIKSFGINGIMQ